MRMVNFNVKDRKLLYSILAIVLVSVFTLTIAYAALNAVLTIQGSVQVSSADWNIHLANPRVTSGSSTTNLPVIKTSSTLEFSTILNMPGDFYEFIVDVVNDGSIDAMIENVIKLPELTDEQAKYLKYEVSYQNNENITTNQLIAKGKKMPIKVRVEYREDLSNEDLPTEQVVLNLSLTLEYIQSNSTGNSVNNNGFIVPIADGNVDDIGTIVTIGSEKFYTIKSENNSIHLLSMYNLYVGGEYTSGWKKYGNEATGIQDKTMIGYIDSQTPRKGTTAFANETYKGTNYSDYSGSLVEHYVNNYGDFLNAFYGIDIVETRLITKEELSNKDTFNCGTSNCSNSTYSWIYSTSYWIGSSYNNEYIYNISSYGGYGNSYYSDDFAFGVRPVIVISKDYFQ